jgi:hypothetical protein
MPLLYYGIAFWLGYQIGKGKSASQIAQAAQAVAQTAAQTVSSAQSAK